MALKLMESAFQLPYFQPNQVLTFKHLNDLASFLFQQERYTRNKLIGTGIVCGLSFSWSALGNTNAQVLIDDGIAITSGGYLIVFKQPSDAAGLPIPYTHKRNFTRIKDFKPFDTVIGNGNPTIHELITLDMFNAETTVPKSVLLNTDKNNHVLILLYDMQALGVAKCLDEGCDDKGKIYDCTPRPLLVPIAIIDAIVGASNTANFFTESGRSWKAREDVLFSLDYLWNKNLFRNNNIQNINTPAELVNLFKAPCLDPELDNIRNKVDLLFAKFPWIFTTQMDCLKTEIPSLVAQSLGSLFKSKAQTFRNSAANDNYMQYLYDYLRDVIEGYNELFSAVTDLVGECGGNEFIHPFHVMLGLPTTNDTLACYKEEKYNEHHFKYRHYFIPSPVMDGQFMLFEKVQSLFKRLARIVANFNVSTTDVAIRITPSKDYDKALGERALPYFYQQTAADSIRKVWNYDATRRNKLTRIKGYHLGFNQDQLLDEDTCRNDFYRIEGHIGSVLAVAEAEINTLRKRYNLPFSVSSVSIQLTTDTVVCSFPDLQAEFSFFRDRALGILQQILDYWEKIQDKFSASPVTKDFYDRVSKGIKEMTGILLEVRCIEQFPYDKFKDAYISIWEAVFEIFSIFFSMGTSGVNQGLNTMMALVNFIFFKPVYRIWYLYLYRIQVITQSTITGLKTLAGKTTGLEHLAGVRRGDTFLLVSDSTQGGKIVADFNLPDIAGCSCDCKAEPCKGDKRVKIIPLQIPIIMAVDLDLAKGKKQEGSTAIYDAASKSFVLELSGYGFYKADDVIQKNLVILDDQGKPFKNLTGTWQNERLLLRYKGGKVPKKMSFLKLTYRMLGDFDGGYVEGLIFLFVFSDGGKRPAGNTTVVVGNKPRPIYVYDKVEMSKLSPKLTFDGESRIRAFDGQRVSVYTTPLGNEYGIFRDEKELPYIMAVNAKAGGIDEVPYVLRADDEVTKGELIVNVVEKGDNLTSDVVSGVIKDDRGQPAKNVKVSSMATGEEVETDEAGRYTLTGVKSGDVITAAKRGYKTASMQANSSMEADRKLLKDAGLNEKMFGGLDIAKELGGLTDRLGVSSLRKFLDI